MRAHQRRQREILASSTASKERKAKVRNRLNDNFERASLPDGSRGTRRKKRLRWKPKDAKPHTGKKTIHHELGKMLRVIRSMDRQFAGKLLRPFFNSPFYQVCLAEADRLMQEITLPELKPTRRIKANRRTGASVYTRVDPRRQLSFKTMRRVQKVLTALDRFLNPDLGPRPVQPLSEIDLIDIGDSNEEANTNADPNGWIGRKVDQPEVDESTNLVLHMSFLMAANNFGNLPGDKEKFDDTGNFIIVKNEPVSASER